MHLMIIFATMNIHCRNLFTATFASLLICSAATAQSKVPALDQSGMDMSYYPPNYPILKIQDKVTEPLTVRVVYSRPQRSGRTVFGQLVEYDQVWRMGANEATEIEFFRNVIFGGKPVPKGKYTLYSIPGTSKWTVILNKETDTWGSFIYDQKKDFVRIEVLPEKAPDTIDYFSLFFEKSEPGFNMIAEWENTMITVPISIPKAPVKAPAKPAKTPAKTVKK